MHEGNLGMHAIKHRRFIQFCDISVGMEIPGYIANSGAGISTIKSMSKKMKTMGRRKRLRKS